MVLFSVCDSFVYFVSINHLHGNDVIHIWQIELLKGVKHVTDFLQVVISIVNFII